jgi:hypothetical protein
MKEVKQIIKGRTSEYKRNITKQMKTERNRNRTEKKQEYGGIEMMITGLKE